MHKLYSELIGMPVFDEYSASPVALIQDVLVDTETGKIVGLLVKKDHIIVPIDIERIGKSIRIKDQEHIVPIDDVLRAKNVFKMHIPIIGAKVLTERQNIYLGRVVDYEISVSDMSLWAIHCAKTIMFFRFQEKLINRNSIISINKHSVIVKDSFVTVSSKEEATARAPVVAA